MKQKIGYLDIASSLGLKEDDVVFIASDLTRLAFDCMERGESFDGDAFIDSFIAQLPHGTIVIPTFTDDYCDGMTYDVRKSKPTIGALPKIAFNRTDGIRTMDPFHSVKVWGKHESLFKSSTEKSTFGANSGFGLLHQLNAKMLLIDVTIKQAFTYVHYCEESAKAPWRKFVNHRINIVDYDGNHCQQVFLFYTRKKGIINWFFPLQSIFLEDGTMKIVTIKDIPIGIVDLSKAYHRIIQDIQQNKGRNTYQFSFFEWGKLTIKQILNK